MKHLTLNELAPYLPYKLRIMHHDGSNKTMIGLDFYYIYFKEGFLEKGQIKRGNKPILRPLSDLTKPEFKGKLKAIKYRIDANGIEAIISDVSQGVAEYDLMLMLFENHFDVFNLIPQGLAIDINTIK